MFFCAPVTWLRLLLAPLCPSTHKSHLHKAFGQSLLTAMHTIRVWSRLVEEVGKGILAAILFNPCYPSPATNTLRTTRPLTVLLRPNNTRRILLLP